MSSRPELHIAPCGYDAAKFAVEHWHYSGSMPAGKRVAFGVWEGDDYKGCILFSRGASPTLGGQYDLNQDEVCELTRIALRQHEWEVTRMMRFALNGLQKKCPGLRLVVSFSDLRQGHHGGIYRGGNWYYTGEYDASKKIFLVNGERVHGKTLHSKYGVGGQSLSWLQDNVDPNAEYADVLPKLRYCYPLDEIMRERVEAHSKPYPNPEDLPAPEA